MIGLIHLSAFKELSQLQVLLPHPQAFWSTTQICPGVTCKEPHFQAITEAASGCWKLAPKARWWCAEDKITLWQLINFRLLHETSAIPHLGMAGRISVLDLQCFKLGILWWKKHDKRFQIRQLAKSPASSTTVSRQGKAPASGTTVWHPLLGVVFLFVSPCPCTPDFGVYKLFALPQCNGNKYLENAMWF